MDLWWFYRLAKLLIQCSIVSEILNIVSSQTNSTINISCVTTTAFMKSRVKIPGILWGPLPEIVSSTLHGQGKFFRASNKNILTIISSSVYPIEGLKPLNCEEETIFQILYENLCEIGLWLKLDQDVKIGLRIQNFDFSFVKNLRSEQNRRCKHFRLKQTSNNYMARRFVKLCGALNVAGQKLKVGWDIQDISCARDLTQHLVVFKFKHLNSLYFAPVF